MFNDKKFPDLSKPKADLHIQQLLQSDRILNLIISTIIKIS